MVIFEGCLVVLYHRLENLDVLSVGLNLLQLVNPLFILPPLSVLFLYWLLQEVVDQILLDDSYRFFLLLFPFVHVVLPLVLLQFVQHIWAVLGEEAFEHAVDLQLSTILLYHIFFV